MTVVVAINFTLPTLYARWEGGCDALSRFSSNCTSDGKYTRDGVV